MYIFRSKATHAHELYWIWNLPSPIKFTHTQEDEEEKKAEGNAVAAIYLPRHCQSGSFPAANQPGTHTQNVSFVPLLYAYGMCTHHRHNVYTLTQLINIVPTSDREKSEIEISATATPLNGVCVVLIRPLCSARQFKVVGFIMYNQLNVLPPLVWKHIFMSY